MDVDNDLDYKKMVKKILSTTGDLGAMKILVDMKHIEKLPHQAYSKSGSKELSSSNDKHKVIFL